MRVTTMLLRSLLLLTITSISSGDAFIFEAINMAKSAFTAHPGLKNLSKTDCKIDISLDIGEQNAARFVLQGLQLDLTQNVATGAVNLPGSSGPHPQTSSGAHEISVKQQPFFISMNGLEKVELTRGAWEIVWYESSPSGTMICGFEIDKEVTQRNVKIPACRIYISFPLFTAELLTDMLQRKAEVTERANGYQQEKNESLEAMEKTDNLFRKAMHYRDAIAAFEKLDMTGLRYFEWVPSLDEVVTLPQGLLLGKKGTISISTKEMLFGSKTPCGSASIKELLSEDDASKLGQ
jgi:hypothetical protein